MASVEEKLDTLMAGFARIEATLEARGKAFDELKAINSRIDTVVLNLGDKNGQQDERLAKLENTVENEEDARKDSIIAERAARSDAIVTERVARTTFEANHAGPGGDHDRQRNTNLAIWLTILSGAIAGAFTLVLYIAPRLH